MIFDFAVTNTNATQNEKRANIDVLSGPLPPSIGGDVRIGRGEFGLLSSQGPRFYSITVPLSGATNDQRRIAMEFKTGRSLNFDISISKIEFTV